MGCWPYGMKDSVLLSVPYEMYRDLLLLGTLTTYNYEDTKLYDTVGILGVATPSQNRLRL